MEAVLLLCLLAIISHHQPAAQPAYVLSYLVWSGTSPGAGFTSTTLHVVEIDLPARRARVFRKQALAPNPMLPYDDAGINKLIADSTWFPLTSAQVEQIRLLITTWKNTAPPAEYDQFRALGREDGYREQLTVSDDYTTTKTAINPRGHSADRTLPQEWVNLIKAISALHPPITCER